MPMRMPMRVRVRVRVRVVTPFPLQVTVVRTTIQNSTLQKVFMFLDIFLANNIAHK